MMKKKMKHVPSLLIIGFALIVGLIVGCSKDSSTGPSTINPTVNMAVSFSKAGISGLMKMSGPLAVDSLRIDSAVVVLARITFEPHIDSVIVDTMEGAPDDSVNPDLTFKGPFVIHVRDTVGIDFASQVLPAGTYDGIKFKIHRLHHGEHHEDSDDHNHLPPNNDSTIIGSSITVWGAVKKSGVWTNFTYNFDGEIEFKIKGTFIIASPTNTVNIALNFNMGSWFVNPQTGVLLDPTDTSHDNKELIRRAIYKSFGKGRGGHDRGDGHPDD